MLQAFHILRKDIRYLWIEILAVLLSVGLFLFTAAQSPWVWNAPLPRTVASFLMQFLLPFAWWTLITRAVHAEPLLGDRQFWPTRPYAWRSLLAAKVLLFLLFVNLPMLIAQAIVVQTHGFSVGAEIPGLLWSQVLLTLVVVLPIAGIAAVTASVVQFLVIALVGFVAAILLSLRWMLFAAALVGGGWVPLEWINVYYGLLVIAVAAPAVLIWQYAMRRAVLGRVLAAAAVVVLVVGVPLPWTTAFALQSRLSRNPNTGASIRAGFYSDFAWMTRALMNRDGTVSLHVPLQLANLPDGLKAVPEGLSVTIEGPGGAVWHGDPGQRAHVSSIGQLIALNANLDGWSYKQVKDQPVKIHGYLYLTLYGNRKVSKVPFSERPQRVPGLGLCSASARPAAPYFLVCNSLFKPSPDSISVQFEELTRDTRTYEEPHSSSYSPFPAQFSLDPVNAFTSYSIYKGKLDAVTITSMEPIVHLRAPLSIEGLEFAKYERKL